MKVHFGWSLLLKANFLKQNRVQPLLDEANELTRIMASSRITASSEIGHRRKTKSAIGNRQSAMSMLFPATKLSSSGSSRSRRSLRGC